MQNYMNKKERTNKVLVEVIKKQFDLRRKKNVYKAYLTVKYSYALSQ